MAQKRETRRQMSIQKALRKKYGRHLWLFKVHGGPFQKAGIPDLVGVCFGLFFGFEVKEPDGTPSVLQIETIADIVAAGGIGAFIVTPQEAIDVMEHALGKAARSRIVDFVAGNVRPIFRTTNRQDLHNYGRLGKAAARKPRGRNRLSA